VKRWLILALAGLLALGAMTAGYAWYTFASPWGYARPAGMAAIAPGEHRVFVYGTLRHGVVRWLVYGDWGDPASATLPGYVRDELDIVPQPGGRVPGALLRVDAGELARLDRYERLGVRYRRVRVTLADGRQAWVYDRLGPEE